MLFSVFDWRIMRKISTKLKIVIGVIALVLIVNLVWVGYSFFKWKPYCEAVGYSEEYEDYLYVEGDYETGRYSYGVSLPGYLSFDGNLSISQAPFSNSNAPTIDLVIYPKGSHYEIMVMISEYEYENEDTILEGHTLVLNEKMEFINEPSKDEQKTFDNFEKEIKVLYDKMYDMWGIK